MKQSSHRSSLLNLARPQLLAIETFIFSSLSVLDNISASILRLALPSILSNVTVPLLGLVDQAIVGHLGSPSFIAAVAVGSMVFNVIYWLFGFLRMTTSGQTSQAFGRGSDAGVMAILERSLVLALLFAVPLLVLRGPLLDLALRLIGPSTVVAGLTRVYYSLVILGLPAVFCQSVLSGWFVGMQDTRSPMVISIFQVAANVTLSFVLVFGFGLSLRGVALGTLLSQWLGLVLALLLWRRRYGRLLSCRSPLRRVLRGSEVRDSLRQHADIFLRTLFLVAVNFSFTAIGARHGDIILSANTLLLLFSTLFSYLSDGFAYAAEALSGRCRGAGDVATFRLLLRRLGLMGALLALVVAAAYLLGGNLLLHMLTSEASVLAACHPYLFWVWLLPLCGIGCFLLDGVFVGMTSSRAMLLSSATATLVFVVTYLSLGAILHNHALWLAFLLFLVVRGLVLLFCLPRSIASWFPRRP